MQPLVELIRQAEGEVARQLQVCNACRYCEGFCAVFPAMTRRLEFPKADAHYLANLCHQCGACFHACQYASPHEFAVNLPQALARVRKKTYAEYAWPAPLGRLYERNGLTVALALAFGLALFLLLALATQGTLRLPANGGNFYAVFPHNLMVSLFGPIFLFALFALGMGVVRFWRDITPAAPANAPAALEATGAALSLRFLDGGHGEGCHNDSDAWTHARRRAHHLTFYGFMLCFASTSVATLYHYVWGWQAPYAVDSLPVLLGTVGGIMLCLGTAGLFKLHLARHPQQGAPEASAMDLGFIALLFWVSATGLALLAGRSTSAMAVLLAVHLGAVMALFITLPYGKFAHGVFRGAALLKWAIEKRLPNRVGLTGE